MGWLIIIYVVINYCLYIRNIHMEYKLKKEKEDMKFKIKMLEIQNDLRDIHIRCLKRQLKYYEWKNEK